MRRVLQKEPAIVKPRKCLRHRPAKRAYWAIPIALVTSATHALAQFPPVQQAPPAVPEGPREPARESPLGEMSVASRRFARAVQRFDTAAQRLDRGTTIPNEQDLSVAIEYLAQALESAPHANHPHLSDAIAEMRAALREARWAGPAGSRAANQALTDALYTGTDALLDLARGPYQGAPEMPLRAWELENTLECMHGNDSSNERRRIAFALRQSAVIMNAMVQMPPWSFRQR